MRYLPLTPIEEKKILDLCGESSFDSLTRDIPDALRLNGPLKIPSALAETELLSHINELGEKNSAAQMLCLLGQGAYDHTWPAAIDYLTSRGEFLTAYTPYQPEVSQGTLQYIFEFQSMIANLLGMEVANASLYDGSTALVEAVLMAVRLQNKNSGTVYLSEGTFEHTKKILATYLLPLGFRLANWIPGQTNQLDADAVVIALQSPNRWGLVEDWRAAVELAQKNSLKSVAYVPHAHSCALFESPGHCGIDIAAGEGQSLGIPLGFGGPYLGLFACNKKDVRQMPGRLVGKTVDARGREAFCVTLSTREQHIRREKATSNICSNQSLMALRATIYLALMGPYGLRKVAENSTRAAYAAQKMIREIIAEDKAFGVLDAAIFNEFSILFSDSAQKKVARLQVVAEKYKILLGIEGTAPRASGFTRAITLAFTERFKQTDLEKLKTVFSEVFP